ncbi:MAG: hypothetical protein Tsb009_11240 [Planctomycetaceae bacterium]
MKYGATNRLFMDVAILNVAIVLGLMSPVWGDSTIPDKPVRAEHPVHSFPYHRIYLPADEWDPIFSGKVKGVMLTPEAFQKLYRQAERAQKALSGKLPGMHVLHVNYRGRIQDDQLLVTAQVTFQQSSSTWHQLSLPLNGFHVEQAALNGKPALIGRDPHHRETLILWNQRAGRNTLTLSLSVPFHRIGDDQIATLGLTGHPVGIFSIMLPQGRFLQVDGAELKRPAENALAANYQFAVGSRRRLQLRITGEKRPRPTDALLLARTVMNLNVSAAMANWNAETTLEVSGKARSQLQFSVPGNLKVTAVTGNGLRSWEWLPGEDDESRSTMILTFQKPVLGNRVLRFKGLRPLVPNEFWSVPNLVLKDADSHIGQVTLTHSADLRLRADEYLGVTPLVNTLESGRETAGEPLTFRIWQENFELMMYSGPRATKTTAHALTTLTIDEQSARFKYVASLQGLLHDVRVLVPAEWKIELVLVNGIPAQWTSPPLEAQRQHLWIHLPTVNPKSPITKTQKKKRTENSITVLGRRLLEYNDNPDEPSAEFQFPKIRLSSVDSVRGVFAILGDHRLEIVPSKLTGLTPMKTGIPQERFSYRYEGQPSRSSWYAGQLKVIRRPADLSVRTVTYSRWDPDALRSRIDAEITIRGGGTKQMIVSLPEQTGTKIQFQWQGSSGELIEQSSSTPKQGWRDWTLKFDRRLVGRGVLSVALESSRKSSTDTPQRNTDIVHNVVFHNVASQTGFVGIAARDDQRIEISATEWILQPNVKDWSKGKRGPNLDEVDPIDIPAFAPGGQTETFLSGHRVVAAFRYLTPEYRVALSSAQLAGPPIPRGICRECQTESLLFVTGEFQHRTTYIIETNHVQGFHLTLPEGAELWSTLLNGQPVEIRNEAQGVFLGIQQPNQTRQTLQLFYRTIVEIPQGVGHVRQKLPDVTVVNSEGNETPLEILEHTWTFYKSPETFLVGSGGLLRTEDDYEHSSLVHNIFQKFLEDRGSHFAARLIALLMLAGGGYLAWIATARFGPQGLLVAFGIVALIGLAIILPRFVSLSGSKNAPRNANYYDSTQTKRAEDAKSESIPGKDNLGYGSPVEKGKFEGEGLDETNSAKPAKKPSRSESMPFGDEKPKLPSPGTKVPISSKTSPEKKTQQVDIIKVGESSSGRDSLARLSVPISFRTPANHTSHQFHYYGSQNSGESHQEPVQLDVVLEDRSAGAMLRICLAFGVTLLLWWLRSFAVRLRGGLATVGILLPLILISFAPVLWHLVLDGLFFGSILGVLLWGGRSLLAHFQVTSAEGEKTDWSVRRFFKTSILPFLLFSNWSLAIDAAETKPVSPKQSSPREIMIPPRTVIVPIDAGQTPLRPNRLFVPYSEFSRLQKLINPKPSEAAIPPFEGMVLQAIHAGEIKSKTSDSGWVLQVKSRILFHSFLDRQIILPVPLKRVALISATLDGQPAPLVSGNQFSGKQFEQRGIVMIRQQSKRKSKNHPEKGLQLPMKGRGLHVLDLTFELPVQPVGSGFQVNLPLTSVIVGRCSITLPQGDFEITLNESSRGFRRRTVGQQTMIEFAIPQPGDSTLRWQPKSKQPESKTQVVHAELQSVVHLDDTGIRKTTRYVLDVRRGKLNEVRLSVPANGKLVRLTGAEVALWQLEMQDGQRVVRVFFQKPISGQTEIQVEYRQPKIFSTDGTEVSFSPTNILDIDYQNETMQILAAPYLKVRLLEQTGYRQVASVLSGTARKHKSGTSSSQKGFRGTWQSSAIQRHFQLEIIRLPEETDVSANHAVFVTRKGVRLVSRFTFNMKNTARKTLAILLPERYRLDQVSGDNVADWSVNSEALSLFVELKTRKSGSVSFQLTGQLPYKPVDQSLPISIPVPVMTNRLTNDMAIWLEPDLTATVKSAEGWSEKPFVDTAHGQKNSFDSVPRQPRFSFRSVTIEPEPVELTLAPQKTNVLAESLTIIRVADLAVHHTVIIKWSQLNRSVNSVAFTTPSWLAEHLDFRVSQHVRVRRDTDAKLPKNRIRWIVEPLGESRQTLVVVGTATLGPPRTTNNRIRAAILSLEVNENSQNAPTFQPIVQQIQAAIITNESSKLLEAEKPKSLQHISSSELPRTITLHPGLKSLDRQAVDRIRIAPGSSAPTWRLRKFPRRRESRATINRATLTTVVEQDGSWKCRAIYHVRNRSRQFLALLIPEKSRVLSVVVNGRTSRVFNRNNKENLYVLVPMPKSSEADLSFQVKLILAGKLPGGSLPKGFQLQGSALDLPAPYIVSPKQDKDLGIPVASTRWEVHLPSDYRMTLVKKDSVTNVTAVDETTDSDNWVNYQDARSLIRVLSSRDAGAQKKFQAWKNLKQLETKLQDLPTTSTAQQAEREFVLEQTRRLRQQFSPQGKRQLFDPHSDRNFQALNEQQQRVTISTEAKELYLSNAPTIGKNQQNDGKAARESRVEEIRSRFIQENMLPPADGVGIVSGPLTAKGLPAAIETGTSSLDLDMTVVDQLSQNGPSTKRPNGRYALDIDFRIPESTQVMVFTKVGGQPKLRLNVRPDDTGFALKKGLWTLFWLALAGGTLCALWKTEFSSRLRHHTNLILMGTGFLIVCLVSLPWGLAGYAAFLAGFLMWVRKRSASPNS